MAKRRNTKKTEITYRIAKANGLEVLEKHIETAKDEFDMYDIKISGGIIVKDCRVVDGKNGEFIGTPSKESGGNYYPVVYLNDKVTEAILDLINDGDFEETDEQYLTFEKPKKSSKSTKSKKSNSKSKAKDEDEDDDDDDDDDYPF